MKAKNPPSFEIVQSTGCPKSLQTRFIDTLVRLEIPDTFGTPAHIIDNRPTARFR